MRPPAAAVPSLLHGVLLAGVLVLSGCSLLPGGDDEAPATKSDGSLVNTSWAAAQRADVKQGGTLRLAASTMPANFNPLQADSANSDAAKILDPTIGGAVRITADGGWKVDPDYATSVTVDDKDPLKIDVRLNPAAVWQDGEPITAADMIAFWKAQNGSDDAYEVTSSLGYDNIAKVKQGKDEFTYAVTFKKPTSEWPLYIYPRLQATVSKSPELFNSGFRTRAIASNGPFVVTSIDAKAGAVVQEPNPRWWGQRPKLAKITWNIATPEVQAEAFKAEEIDAVDLEDSNYEVAKDSGTVQQAAGVDWAQVTLNGGRGPLEDQDVRRAVAHAINRAPIAKASAAALGGPPAELGSLILVPGQAGYRDSASSIAYDPQQARALLTKAGYVKGAGGMLERKGKPLTLTMPVPRDTPTNRTRAAAIAGDLKEVGIAVIRKPVPAATFFDTYVIPLDFDLVTFIRRGSAFPITAAEPSYFPIDSPTNFTGIGPSDYGKQWDITTGALDATKRDEQVATLDRALFRAASVIPLAVTPVAVAVHDGLVNYGAAQFEQPDWTRVGFLKN